ncbi:cytidylate kinase-like family protein [bacterium]|nr:cytidylate kinase-like family protein [bacterium]
MSLIITIGRQNGSGGREIGKRLATDLDIAFYDNNLLALTAQRTNFDLQYMEKREERAPGLWASFALGVPMGGISAPTVLPDNLFQEQAETIKSVAAEGGCVIVGRASNYVLRDIPTLDIFVYAPIKDRVERKLSLLPPEEKCSFEEMKKKLIAADKARAKFYSYYTGMNWGPGEAFDLNINTGKIGVEGAVEVIKAYVAGWKGGE